MKTPFVTSSTLALVAGFGAAQSTYPTSSCATTLTASYPAPSVAEGYVARLVVQNLTKPRGIKFDTSGNLLVVEANKGVTALSLVDSGGDCVSLSARKLVIENQNLTHGIELSANGSTLYASSANTLWSWEYNANQTANTTAPRTLIQNMEGSDHTTRTLLLSRHAPGIMVVCRGSSSNIDPDAADITTGHSQIKAFDLTNLTEPYNYDTDGLRLGWGLRNEVGIDEEPITGGIYGVENSEDQVTRAGVDIHQNNPAEELNFLGYLNGTYSPNQGRNFGYPTCLTAWDPSIIPSFNGTVGEQFGADGLTTNLTDPSANDTICDAANKQAPRLSFQAHMAPLDILFNPAGTAAWVTFHGSWDRTEPVGYKLSVVEFANGEPTHPNTSTTAAVDIMANRNNSVCPTDCFRPVGLAWDAQGRLFMSSDSTGEIYMITRTSGNATSGAGSNATGTIPSVTPSASHSASGTGGAASPTSKSQGNVLTMSALTLVLCLFTSLL